MKVKKNKPKTKSRVRLTKAEREIAMRRMVRENVGELRELCKSMRSKLH